LHIHAVLWPYTDARAVGIGDLWKTVVTSDYQRKVNADAKYRIESLNYKDEQQQRAIVVSSVGFCK